MQMKLVLQAAWVAAAVTAFAVAAAFWSSWSNRRRMRTTADLPVPRETRGRRGATSPVLVLPLLVVGGWAIAAPRLEERRRDEVDGALAEAARRVVTAQRAHVVRAGDFYAARGWLAPGQHSGLVLPLEPQQRALTFYAAHRGGLVVVVGDTREGRVCEAVVPVRAGDTGLALTCGDEVVH